MELGCDINSQVADRKSPLSEQYKKWGIQHFIMEFPSLKLLRYFKNKIRDFNAVTAEMMTPLHIFCKNMKKDTLIDSRLNIPEEYAGTSILEFLLSNGLNPNCQDASKSLPFLYAAKNSQYDFMVILKKYKSEVNFCNVAN